MTSPGPSRHPGGGGGRNITPPGQMDSQSMEIIPRVYSPNTEVGFMTAVAREMCHTLPKFNHIATICSDSYTMEELLGRLEECEDVLMVADYIYEISWRLESNQERLEEVSGRFGEWAMKNPAWTRSVEGKLKASGKTFQQAWPRMIKAVTAYKQMRNKKSDAVGIIKRHWANEYKFNPLLRDLCENRTVDFLQPLAAMASEPRPSFPMVALWVNRVIVMRLDTPNRSKKPGITATDIREVRQNWRSVAFDAAGAEKDMGPMRQAVRNGAEKHNLKDVGCGFLVSRGDFTWSRDEDATATGPSRSPGASLALGQPLQTPRADPSSSSTSPNTPPGGPQRNPTTTTPNLVGPTPRGGNIFDQPQSRTGTPSLSPFNDPPAPAGLATPSHPISRRTDQPLNLPATHLPEEWEGIPTDQSTALMRSRQLTTICGCPAERIPAAIVAVICKVQKRWTDMEKVKLAGYATLGGGSRVCHNHMRKIASGVIGLKSNISKAALLTNLRRVRNECNDEVTFRRFQQDNPQLFAPSMRPAVTADQLGAWRFFPGRNLMSQGQKRNIDDDSVINTLVDALGFRNGYREFLKEGTVNTGCVFSYWAEIAAEIDEEVKMFHWHQREQNGVPNLGWLRTAVHSLTQQLMRMDPGYWLLYIICRPDHLVWLISYPYYGKLTKPGDKTAFAHVDLNLVRMNDEKRGVNQVQGSVSLTDETTPDCTILVPRMHQPENFAYWVEQLKDRGQMDSTGFIHKINAQNLTAEDLRHCGTGWKNVPCKKFEVRISTPHLPHGSDGPARGERITFLPWLVGITEDHTNLECEEAGSYNDISRAHADFMPGPTSPSGHPNRYATIPYPFPASVRLEGLGLISDALVGRRRWDSLEVQTEVNRIITMKSDRLQEWLGTWRKSAVKEFKKKLRLQQLFEETVFGAKSYYRNQKDFSRQPAPDVEKD